jgi:hypothetical protein
MPASLYRRVRRAAAEKDESVSRYIVEVLEREVGEGFSAGFSPGEQYLQAARLRRRVRAGRAPLETDKSKLMGEG